ncbi:MAG: ATP-binding protein, partial [Rickettsiales bacterium]|nr:ATP-binding protein [Rickettsiales bacterium]
RIILGVAQPFQNISIYDDALQELHNSLPNLDNNTLKNIFWFTERRIHFKNIKEIADKYEDSEAYSQILFMLSNIINKYIFKNVHIFPTGSHEIPDDGFLHLVILPPTHKIQYLNDEKRFNTINDTVLMTCHKYVKFLEKKERHFKNTIIFLLPNAISLPSLVDRVKRYLALEALYSNRKPLKLDSEQIDELKRFKINVEIHIFYLLINCYSGIIVPKIDKNNIEKLYPDFNDINFNFYSNKIYGNKVDKYMKNSDIIIENVAYTLKNNKIILDTLNPILLKKELEHMWAKSNSYSIYISEIWNNFVSHCYYLKLQSYSVLEDAIKEGVKSSDLFALASGKDKNNNYIGLKYNTKVSNMKKTDLLINIHAVKNDLKLNRTSASGSKNTTKQTEDLKKSLTKEDILKSLKPSKEYNSFFMSAYLDKKNIKDNIDEINKEILKLLNTGKKAVHLEVTGESETNFDDDYMEKLKEKCLSLGITNFIFSKT